MYKRTLSKFVERINKNFPALLITGPRQVGKTTLLEVCGKGMRDFVTLDDLQARQFARTNPKMFLQSYKTPLIIDEIQYAPELLNYIKIAIDREKQNGLFWLTGSQKFHLMQGIGESLAGRVAIVDLLGLSQAELDGRADRSAPFLPTETWIENAREYGKTPKNLMDIYERIWLGSFPKVYQESDIPHNVFYSSYLQTYIQRDVREILNVSDEITFVNFITAIAARTGQLLNYEDLSRDIEIDNKTIKKWLSVLETSGLIYILRPYYNNVTKRLIKTPKLYFLDTGLCAYLGKWDSPQSLQAGALSGAILETWLFGEILKSYWHNGEAAHFYYYRDTDQKEIDLLIERNNTLYPIEMKKTSNPSRSAFKHFQLLEKLGKNVGHGGVICFVDRDMPLSPSVTAIPIGYL